MSSHKTKSFCAAKETIKRMKRCLIESEKIFPSYASGRELVKWSIQETQKIKFKLNTTPN